MSENASKQKNSCNDCEKDVTVSDKDLSCCICEKSFHIKCTRFPSRDYNFLQGPMTAYRGTASHVRVHPQKCIK